MGVVYKARQPGLNRVVALKMILGGAHTDPATLARFQAEALAIAKLQYPNIVQIYETGQQEDLPYLSLEYVEGGSLDQRLAGQPMPPREAAELVETLARAVHVAHQAGIIHRDLKPANVLLTPSGVPKITDFGLAKTLGDDRGQTASGAILGTPSYMAPEQAGGRRREITRAVDVYSLGAILYELLTGRPPFRAETPLDTLLLVVSEEVTPPSELCPDVPRDLEAICLKCLRKNPENRYADAEALAEDLHRFLNGEPVSACAATLEQQARRWLRKQPVSGPILVLTACLALFSAAALTYLEPSTFLVSGWVVWIAAVVVLVFLLPDRRGLAVAGFGFLLFAHMGWQTIRAAKTRDTLPFQLSMAWIDATTALCFLLPGRPRGLAVAGLCSLVFGLAFVGTDLRLVGSYSPLYYCVEFLPHPVLVAAYCIVARLVAWAIEGDAPTAVFAGVSTGMIAYCASWSWLYLVPELGPILRGKPNSLEWASVLISLLAGASGAFILTAAGKERWASRIVRWVVNFLAAVRLRVWITVAAVPVAVCLLVLVGRGVWLWGTSRELLTVEGYPGAVYSVAFSPDGMHLGAVATQSNSPPSPYLFIWDEKMGRTARRYDVGVRAWAYCVAFSPDGERLAVALDSQGKPVTVLSSAADREILVPKGLGEGARSLAFSADGKRLAAGGMRGTVKVWDAITGHELLTFRGQGAPVNSVALSPDGTRLATCAVSEAVTLWDATTGKQVSTLRNGSNTMFANTYCYNAAFSPDGKRLAAGGRENTVRVWDVETGQEQFSLVGHTDAVQGVAFSPDGKWLASASHDHTVRVWDAASGQERLKLRGHTWLVYCVAFSPDGKLLASGGLDRTVRIWRITD
jgi:DNA-binding beta-propeller fold protein YncE